MFRKKCLGVSNYYSALEILFLIILFASRASCSPDWPQVLYIAKDDLEPAFPASYENIGQF